MNGEETDRLLLACYKPSYDVRYTGRRVGVCGKIISLYLSYQISEIHMHCKFARQTRSGYTGYPKKMYTHYNTEY
jgi:hypothetical protein